MIQIYCSFILFSFFMTHIYFIRHAQTDQNHNPILIWWRSNHIDISEYWHTQWEALAQRLHNEHRIADAIYSSPAIRTLQTAQYVVKGTWYTDTLLIDDRLQELDQWERTWQSRKEIYTTDVISWINENPWDTGAPGWETIRQVWDRMNQFLEEIVQTHPHGNIRVISHGVAIAAMMMTKFAMTWSQIKMFPVANTSLTHMYYDPHVQTIPWKLLTYSDAAHLEWDIAAYQFI